MLRASYPRRRARSLHAAMAAAREDAESFAALAEAIGNDKTITPRPGR